MKKFFPIALIGIFAVLSFASSCKKSDSSSSSAAMSATVAGSAWSATIDSATNFAGGLWIYGAQISGTNAQVIDIIFTTVPTTGSMTIDGTNVTAEYGTNTAGKEAVYGTVNISAISATNVTGTFSFTCTDSTKVTGGSFNIARH